MSELLDKYNKLIKIHEENNRKEEELYDIMVKDHRMNDNNNLITYCRECHLFKVHGYKKQIDKGK